MSDATKNNLFPAPLALSLRLYAFLLAAYPKAFQEEYRSELSQVFAESAQELYDQNGWRGLMTLWAETTTDLSSSAIAEHLNILGQDIRYGLRTLIKTPGFTAVAVLILALGIGANSAMFSIINTVLLRPLPYANPEQLVVIWQTAKNRPITEGVASPPDFRDWRDLNHSFMQISSIEDINLSLTGENIPERLAATRVSPSFFQLLGSKPLLGRTFLQEEGITAGKEFVVVLSYSLWQRRFAGNPEILGKAITLNDNRYTVIGIMPSNFSLPNQLAQNADLWIPVPANYPNFDNRGGHFLNVFARLKSDVSILQAQAEMSTIANQLAKQYPDTNSGRGIKLIALHEQIVSDIRGALLVLLGAVGFVLLISCTNVANLLLVRAASRQREISIRLALGASRSRLIRQLLTESMLLALMGGFAGLLLAVGSLHLLVLLSPATIPRIKEVSLDIWVLGFTLFIVLLTGIIFGLVPALQASRLDLNESLKESARGNSGKNRLRNGLVIAEVALALVLLTGAGLFLRSFLALQSTDPGFWTKNMLTTDIYLPRSRYEKEAKRTVFFTQLLEKLSHVPGVESAQATTTLPMSNSTLGLGLEVIGHPPQPMGEPLTAEFDTVSPNYQKAMGIRLLHGRYLSERDTFKAPHVALISKAAQRQFFPNEDPIGRHLKVNGSEDLEIVGIVTDVRHTSLEQQPKPAVYTPYYQWTWPFMSIVIQTKMDSASLNQTLRQTIVELDANQPFGAIVSLDQLLSNSLSQPFFRTLLLGLFAGIALLLAAVGIYGVMAYSVTQRTNELGIRLALGAQPGDVLKMILSQGMLLVSVGIGLGLVLSLVTGRLLASFLFGISATDLPAFVGVSLVLAFAALIACYLPAQKATRVDPMIALRQE